MTKTQWSFGHSECNRAKSVMHVHEFVCMYQNYMSYVGRILFFFICAPCEGECQPTHLQSYQGLNNLRLQWIHCENIDDSLHTGKTHKLSSSFPREP